MLYRFRFVAAVLALLAYHLLFVDALAENEWRGDRMSGAAATPAFSVARSAEAWDRLWQAYGQPAPADFQDGRDMAVFIALGSRPTSGYKVNIVGARISQVGS